MGRGVNPVTDTLHKNAAQIAVPHFAPPESRDKLTVSRTAPSEVIAWMPYSAALVAPTKLIVVSSKLFSFIC